jgi:glycyl-tRNA synthetase
MALKQQRLENLLKENHFIIPSYQHYGGVNGYHDYGILGCQVKNKLINIWRQSFLTNNDINEIESPLMVPYSVLKASGHVDRFTDFVVYDENGVCYRADHLAKEYFKSNNMEQMENNVDTWDHATLEAYINRYNMIQAPIDPNTHRQKRIEVLRKNLMFEIINTNSYKYNVEESSFLRPELAQNIFVNFDICRRFLQKPLPFGIAQIGKSFRKEISPKPFIRMREFTQCEIEYFIDPLNKNHHLYDEIKHITIPIMSQQMQLSEHKLIEMSVDDAVNNKIISSNIIGYFLAKIYLFAIKIGLHNDKIRFRQHLPHEMAHYAVECWDLETFVNNGWLECVGCADRGSFDLMSHSKTNKLTAERLLESPMEEKVYTYKLNIGVIGKRYKELTQSIVKHFENLTQEQLKELIDKDSEYVYIDNKICIITKDMISVRLDTLTKRYEEYFPNVIEPSFGIDRLMYSIFEQNAWIRKEDEQRIVLSLPKDLSPYDVAIFELIVKNDEIVNLASTIKRNLESHGLRVFTDQSAVSIGRKYSRVDEIGIKYVITVDPQSLKDNKVTIRNRDTTSQIRVSYDGYILLDELNKLH